VRALELEDHESFTPTVLKPSVENALIPMPFERARTQLLLGQLLRRDRSEATAMLRDALAVFEQLGTQLWADRARAELTGTSSRSRANGRDRLTPAEQRVAEWWRRG